MALKLSEQTLVSKSEANQLGLRQGLLSAPSSFTTGWVTRKGKNMTDTIMCPTCSKYPAIIHSVYGPTACEECKKRSASEWKGEEIKLPAIGKSKKEKRMLHWDEIRSRVKTHEGELLSGRQGREYIQKYGQRYLGMTPSRPNYNAPEYQKELAKTK